MRSVTSRPRAASLRNPETVMVLSGKAIVAATLSRSGASGWMLSGAGIFVDVFSCDIAASRIRGRNAFTSIDSRLRQHGAVATSRTPAQGVRVRWALGVHLTRLTSIAAGRCARLRSG